MWSEAKAYRVSISCNVVHEIARLIPERSQLVSMPWTSNTVVTASGTCQAMHSGSSLQQNWADTVARGETTNGQSTAFIYVFVPRRSVIIAGCL